MRPVSVMRLFGDNRLKVLAHNIVNHLGLQCANLFINLPISVNTIARFGLDTNDQDRLLCDTNEHFPFLYSVVQNYKTYANLRISQDRVKLLRRNLN